MWSSTIPVACINAYRHVHFGRGPPWCRREDDPVAGPSKVGEEPSVDRHVLDLPNACRHSEFVTLE